ncbi:MAG: transposase [Bacteroidetes bacterium]|nr:MAG: transposase [Bacteroidota bacterium]
MSKPRKRFDKNFKLRTVARSYECKNMKDLAQELGIRVELIYRWRSELSSHKEKSFPGEGKVALSPEEARIALLEKQLRQKEQEIEILKKAIGNYSQSQ